MTRNFVVVYDINNKKHIINATDIIDIFDIKNSGFYTICLMDSKSVDISPAMYDKLVVMLKPTNIIDETEEPKPEVKKSADPYIIIK